LQLLSHPFSLAAPTEGLLVTREERDTHQRFRDRYGEDRTEAVVQIEPAVIGGDRGANGYTTVAQADRSATNSLRTRHS
jgi:hypothetical protein